MLWGHKADIKRPIGWVVEAMYMPSGYEGGHDMDGWVWCPKLAWRIALGINQPQTYGRHYFFTTHSNLGKNIETQTKKTRHLSIVFFHNMFFLMPCWWFHEWHQQPHTIKQMSCKQGVSLLESPRQYYRLAWYVASTRYICFGLVGQTHVRWLELRGVYLDLYL